MFFFLFLFYLVCIVNSVISTKGKDNSNDNDNNNNNNNSNSDTQVWNCEFCNTENEVNVAPEEVIPLPNIYKLFLLNSISNLFSIIFSCYYYYHLFIYILVNRSPKRRA